MMKRLLLAGPNSIHTLSFSCLIRDCFNDIFLLTNSKPDNTFSGKYEIINPSLRNPFSLPRKIQKISKLIQNLHPDIIHIHQADTLALLILLAVRGQKIPVVVTAWGSDVLINPTKSFLHRAMLRYIFKHADGFTADAEVVIEKMKQLSPRPIEVRLSGFGIEIPDSLTAKENLIYSNRLHKKLYRIDKVIEAFASFSAKETLPWRMVIAGNGEETESLKQLAAKFGVSDIVDFVGWVDKTRNYEYYNRARIFVSIPESDATSVSLLEAMAHGCLPVVSDLPANREWIQDGVNGLVISNIDDDFLQRFQELRLKETAEINREMIAQKASKLVAAERFCELYKTLYSD